MLILAHRGYHKTALENTMEAFEDAIRIGADGIETDVRLSREGELLLFHDRVSPKGSRIENLSRHELSQQLGYVVPTLEEALSIDRSIIWNIEIKNTNVLDKLANLYQKLGKMRDNIFVSSFMHSTVFDFCQCTGANGGLLIAHDPMTVELDALCGLKNSKVRTIIFDYNAVSDKTLSLTLSHRVSVWAYDTDLLDRESIQEKGIIECTITDHIVQL